MAADKEIQIDSKVVKAVFGSKRDVVDEAAVVKLFLRLLKDSCAEEREFMRKCLEAEVNISDIDFLESIVDGCTFDERSKSLVKEVRVTSDNSESYRYCVRRKLVEHILSPKQSKMEIKVR